MNKPDFVETMPVYPHGYILEPAEICPPPRVDTASEGVDIDAVHRRVEARHKMVQSYAPTSCDKVGRHHEAAHAASEIDDDRNARPLPWYVAELVGVRPEIVTALAVVCAIITVAGGLHYWLT